jgi:hypothetical protein
VLVGVAACSTADDGGTAEIDLVRYECSDRSTATELVGEFAALILERSLQDALSIADVDLRVQVVPSAEQHQELVESLRSELDALADARSCSPF